MHLPDWIVLFLLPFRVLYYALECFVRYITPYRFRKKKCLAGEIAVVTGGGSGIGRCLAIELSRLGVKVVIWDVNLSAAESAQREIQGLGGSCYICVGDVSSRSHVTDMADHVQREVGDVTMLVNNAGIINGKLLVDLKEEEIQRLFGINLLAHYWTIMAFLPIMLKQNRGHIVTMSSVAGLAGICRMSDYSASKAAVSVLHQAVEVEARVLGGDGIDMTLVSPYLVDTGMLSGAKARFPWLMPVVSPHYVAKLIVRSILLRERQLVIPDIMRFLIFIFRLLPAKILDSPEDVFGMRGCMDNFVGHMPRKELPVITGSTEL